MSEFKKLSIELLEHENDLLQYKNEILSIYIEAMNTEWSFILKEDDIPSENDNKKTVGDMLQKMKSFILKMVDKIKRFFKESVIPFFDNFIIKMINWINNKVRSLQDSKKIYLYRLNTYNAVKTLDSYINNFQTLLNSNNPDFSLKDNENFTTYSNTIKTTQDKLADENLQEVDGATLSKYLMDVENHFKKLREGRRSINTAYNKVINSANKANSSNTNADFKEFKKQNDNFYQLQKVFSKHASLLRRLCIIKTKKEETE